MTEGVEVRLAMPIRVWPEARVDFYFVVGLWNATRHTLVRISLVVSVEKKSMSDIAGRVILHASIN